MFYVNARMILEIKSADLKAFTPGNAVNLIVLFQTTNRIALIIISQTLDVFNTRGFLFPVLGCVQFFHTLSYPNPPLLLGKLKVSWLIYITT